MPLNTLKKDNLIDVKNYAVNNMIDLEPAYDWLDREVLKWSNRLIIKAKHSNNISQLSGYKYGIKIPYNFYQAIEIYRENGNLIWADIILKEESKVQVELKLLKTRERKYSRYKVITCHWFFDLNMELTCRYIFLDGVHLTGPP